MRLLTLTLFLVFALNALREWQDPRSQVHMLVVELLQATYRLILQGESDGIWAWTRFNQLFNYLPLAALIEKKIICMHGGIGRSINSVEQIEKLERPITMDVGSIILMDLLWYSLFCYSMKHNLLFIMPMTCVAWTELLQNCCLSIYARRSTTSNHCSKMSAASCCRKS